MNTYTNLIFNFNFSALQGETEYPGDICDEPVAGGATEGDGGLGWGGPSRGGLVALRGPRRGHHHVGQGQVQVRDAGQIGRRGRIRLGLLRE